MGTIVTTQAGHTYRIIQSNIGLRVQYVTPEGDAEILIHRPDENTAPEVVLNRIDLDLGGSQ